jgi:hypothetical protein
VNGVEFSELVVLLENRLAVGDQADPWDAGFSAQADRLSSFLTGIASPDPDAVLTLIGFRWRQFQAGAASMGRPQLQAMAGLAVTLPADRLTKAPEGLQALISIDPDVTGDPPAWYEAALRPDCPLDQSIALFLVTAHMSDVSSTLRLACLNNLSLRQHTRFRERGEIADLDDAIAALRELAVLNDEPDGQLPDLYGNLSLMLRARYRVTGVPADLNDAIDFCRYATTLRSPDPAVLISGLAISLRHRFERHRQPADLNEAITSARRAARLMGARHPEARIILTNLAHLLLYRHRLTGAARHLEQAAGVARRAAAPVLAKLACDPHADQRCVDTLEIFAEVLTRRYQQKRREKDLDDALQAVSALQTIIQPARAKHLRHQRDLLLWRFLTSEHQPDLNDAIDAATAVYEGDGNDAHRLASLLYLRYRVAGSLSDAARAVLLLAGRFPVPLGRAHPRSATIREVFERLLRVPDPALLFDRVLDSEPETLGDMPLGTARDLAALCMFGWLFWLRADYQTGPRAAHDRSLAAELFYPVFQVAPTSLPDSIVRFHAERGDVDRAERFNEAGMYCLNEYLANGDIEAARAGIREFRKSVEAAGPDSPHEVAGAANNLGMAILRIPEEQVTEPLVQEAVAAMQRSVELSQPHDSYLPGRLSVLCAALTRLYRVAGDTAALEDAIAAGRRGVALTPAGHPSAGMHLSNLACALSLQPTSTQAEAIKMYSQALAALPPEHYMRPGVLANLVAALDKTDDDVPVEELLGAVDAMPSGADRVLAFQILLRAWQHQDPGTHDAEHLSTVIDLGRQIVATLPDGAAEELIFAVDLAEFLRESNPELRDEKTAREEAQIRRDHITNPIPVSTDTLARLSLTGLRLLDLAETLEDPDLRAAGLSALRNAVSAAPIGDPLVTSYEASLVVGLHETYVHTRDVPVLLEEVALSDAVLQATSDNDPDLLIRLERSIMALQYLYADTGDSSRLDDSYTRAVRAAQMPGASWSNRVNLADVLMARGQLTGNNTLIKEAVRVARDAATEITDDRSHLPAFANVARVLMVYYERTDASDVLDEAIVMAERVITGTGAQLSSSLNTVGRCRWLRYLRHNDIQDLRESVDVQRQAAAAVPLGYPYRSLYLNSLCEVLLALSALDDEDALLREAADHGRAAVVAAGGNTHFRALASAGLADVLLRRYAKDRDADALAEARASAENALRDGDDHPRRDYLLDTLARTLATDRTDLRRARRLYAEAATFPLGTGHNRLVVTARWAALAMELDDPADALHACEYAAELLLVHAGPALRREDRERSLRDAAWLPRTAAAAAIAAGNPARALELLEQVRGILLAEALHAREDLGVLRAQNPDLAEEFVRVSNELAALQRDSGTVVHAAEQRAELAHRWHSTVQRIRQVPGHGEFLLPPTAARLLAGINGGWLVVVNISEWRSDALVLDGTTVSVVELRDLRADDAVERINAYLITLQRFQSMQAELATAQAEAARNPASPHGYQAAKTAFAHQLNALEDTLGATLEWLWSTIAEPILRHLDLTTSPDGSHPLPRLWWCPTGALALLPLHAAGRHQAGPGHAVMERVVSSYTPTIRAFQAARAATPARHEDARMLIVTMPTTEGRQPLPSTERERDLLRELFPGSRHTLFEGPAARRDAVLRELPHHGWIHLSCHGDQDLHNPSRGGLMLADGMLTFADLYQHSRQAELTVLSACKTATGGVELADEMITLAAVMHYGGSRHVIGTLWSVYDHTTANITEDVYRHLIGAGWPADDAADALHQAIRRLRDAYPEHPSVWIPYIHIGP